MYEIGRSHYPRAVFHIVVRRDVRLNEGLFNISGGAVQRLMRSILTPDPSAEYNAADSPQKYNITGSRPDTSHQCRHPRWTVCQAVKAAFGRRSNNEKKKKTGQAGGGCA